MPDDTTPSACARCGRAVRLLNEGSDTPRCVGCGFVPELCRCDPND